MPILKESEYTMRQILLDTETTGFNPKNGDRIIEIGAVEMISRKLSNHNYHQYIQPEREVPEDAIAVHGITDAFLEDKPVIAEIIDDFMEYVKGAELIIHNAPFDVGFINHELSLLSPNKWGTIEDHCKITDSLKMARKAYPRQRVSLDALCKKLGIGNSNRTLHGALLDSEILADVYLLMTGGQTNLSLKEDEFTNETGINRISSDRPALKILMASSDELANHQTKMTEISKKSGMELNW